MAQNRNSQGQGPKQRQLRVGELIRRTLADVLARADVHDPDLNRHSITVAEVSMSTDLKVATAYVLPLGGRDAPEALAALRRNTPELRHLVAKAMTLKFAPELRFQLDETFDRMDDTRRLFEDERVRRDVAARTGTTMTPDLPRLAAVAVGMLVAMALPSGAAQCERVDHDGQGYVLCQVEAAQEPALRLFQDGPDGAPLRNFANVRRTLDAGQTLSFAMNAGMFHADYRPVGLLVVDGVELSPIVTGASRDNFGMLPNGVFCTGGAQPFQVIESVSFAETRPDCRLASQSGRCWSSTATCIRGSWPTATAAISATGSACRPTGRPRGSRSRTGR